MRSSEMFNGNTNYERAAWISAFFCTILMLNSTLGVFLKIRLILFIWEAQWQSKRGRERSSLCWWLLSDCNSWHYSSLKPGPWNFISVSHVHDKGPNAWVMVFCFPRPLTGKWIGIRAARTESVVAIGCKHCLSPCHATFLVPTWTFFIYDWYSLSVLSYQIVIILRCILFSFVIIDTFGGLEINTQ